MARPSNNYPAELRERSVAMFNEIRKDYPSDWMNRTGLSGGFIS
jgi:transposase